jgi:hypothetical protein
VCAGGARGDILLVLRMRDTVTIVDVSVIHPQGVSALVASAGTPEAAVAHRDVQKVATYTYGTLEPHRFSFVPLPVETYGRLGARAMRLRISSTGSAPR